MGLAVGLWEEAIWNSRESLRATSAFLRTDLISREFERYIDTLYSLSALGVILNYEEGVTSI